MAEHTKVLELKQILNQDDPSAFISTTWTRYNQQRIQKINEWLELRDYIFATDTATTTNNTLPWKNKTTTPKLCQIRDNLHSNYISSLFPNDKWLKWEAFDKKAATKNKAKTICSYMDNKCREAHFRNTISQLVLDYIDYGNCFGTVSFSQTYKELADGTKVPDYIGPVLTRISPLDIVFNPLGDTFKRNFKVVRSVRGVGELKKLAQDDPEQKFWLKAIERRETIGRVLGGYSYEDFQKACGYTADGFGNMYEYYRGSYMEVLEFFGDYMDPISGEIQKDRVITICDRSFMARNEAMPQWYGGAPIVTARWRIRPDNLWGMGPLDNLVGMQYRIDHLENLKADALDLLVQPPLKIKGEVEAFVWGPSSEIRLSGGESDVEPLNGNLNPVAMANQNITELENKMELYAGAPRDAMGIRTPGEKTAFEVQQLNNAAGRIFQEKVQNFEMEFLEPILNMMLETACRNMDGVDIIRTLDNDIGVQEFMSITKQDITANGQIRPIGARHFAQQSQDLQNAIGIFGSPIGQMIQQHVSSINLAKFVEDVTNLAGYDIFQPNVKVFEDHQTQSLANQAQEDMAVQQGMPAQKGV
jgi:hypothetical protein